MDIQAVKVLLEAQDKTFKAALDIVVEQLKSRIQSAEGTISELKVTQTDLIRSLEYTQAELKDLQREVQVLRKSESEYRIKTESQKVQIEELENRANYQEDYNRRNNLRFTGIQENPGETWEETASTVTKLIEDKLQLPAVKLERAHRVGPLTSSRSRTIVARFERFGDREAVVRNARKLKGSGIYINEDLCPASLEIKKSQIPAMKKAREEGKIAFFRHTKLIIKERANQQNQQTGPAKNKVTSGDDVTVMAGASAASVGDGDGSVRRRTAEAGGATGGRPAAGAGTSVVLAEEYDGVIADGASSFPVGSGDSPGAGRGAGGATQRQHKNLRNRKK